MTVRIEQSLSPAICIARLDEELDISVVDEVRKVLDEAIEAGCVNVVLDLDDVTYVDSSALGLLVWIDKRLEPFRGKVVLAGANRDVGRILELSGLVGLAPTVATASTVSSAIAGIGLKERPSDRIWIESLEVPASIGSLAQVRGKVCELVSRVGMSETSLFDVKVAVGEALANAIRHGSPRGENDRITIDVAAYDDRITVAIADTGSGFDGADYRGSEDVYAASGRGVMFMRALMDRVEFAPCAEGGTVVTLVKHLPPSGPGTAPAD